MTRSILASTALAALLLVSPALAEELPLKRVILSTSGLAHFEHQGEVTGNTKLELPVRLDQVDDLMKSLVVFDAKGRLGGVSVPGRAPLSQAFRDLPFSQNDLGSPIALLNALKGSSVKVAGSSAVEGLLVSVIPERAQIEDGTIIRHRVTVLSPGGLQSVVLEDLAALQFTDQEVRDQVAKGLQAIFEHRVQDQRTLSVDLKGDGARDVALSYVVEAPLWKSSYRMVLPGTEESESLVQGWAVMENMTGSDWDGVEITLISGNPVTYKQSLYTSYYVPRPDLPVEVMGRVMPRVDKGTLGELDEVRNMQAANAFRDRRERASVQIQDFDAERRNFGGAAESMAMADMAMPASAAPMAKAQQMANMQQAAMSEDATTQVLFRFPDPFTVESGHSLMLPFVSASVPAERLWLYQPDTHAEHPLSSIRLTNTSDAGLPPGILTLYEPTSAGTTYVGDAQLPVIPKGEERLVSFALDSKTKIDRKSESERQVVQASISEGVLRQRVSQKAITNYIIKAPAEEERTILLEHPRQTGWTLEGEDEGIELTANHYRIKVTVPAGETVTHRVTLSRVNQETLGLVNISQNQINHYLRSLGKLDPKLKSAFEEMASLRRGIDRVQQEIRRLEQERNEIRRKWQDNRDNYRTFGRGSDIGSRILKTMNQQMDRMEDIDKRVEKLNDELRDQQQRLNKYVGNLRI
ncbi:MAG: hypothetical protein Alpg2KO_19590 [Alphaproteobacteria bacterium]